MYSVNTDIETERKGENAKIQNIEWKEKTEKKYSYIMGKSDRNISGSDKWENTNTDIEIKRIDRKVLNGN